MQTCADCQAEFRPPTMYYTQIPSVTERSHNRRWDAAKLRDLRKRLDSGTMTVEDIDGIVGEFIEGEIVDLASDWLGNTVSKALHKLCPRYSSRIAGRAEVIREVQRHPQASHAGAVGASPRHDWHPQKWHLGRAEGH